MVKAVLWDFGGVLTSSPFEAFRRFESENGYPDGFIGAVNAANPDDNAWAKLERGEISLEEFDRLFDDEARARGKSLPGRLVLPLLFGDLRPQMVEALRRCSAWFKTACLTNNIASGGEPDGAGIGESMAAVMGIFDLVFESSKIGLRKPEPQFYRRALDELGVAAAEAVYLDDLGINLKPARAMGMTTIKVVDPGEALARLETVTGLDLRSPAAGATPA